MTTVSTNKKKKGRPTKPVKKEMRASVRFTRPEYFIIQQKAATAGMTVSRYIRRTAIHTTVSARLSEEDRQLMRKLVGMDNNINQIATACHKEGVLRAMSYFQSIRTVFDDILKKFKS